VDIYRGWEGLKIYMATGIKIWNDKISFFKPFNWFC